MLEDTQSKMLMQNPLSIGVVITREFLMARRQSILMELDALERLLEMSPRTAELRRERKELSTEHKAEKI